MLCFRLKLLCYSSLDFPPPPPLPLPLHLRALQCFVLASYLPPPPIQTLYLVIIDYMGTANGGGGGVGNLREKDRNVVMLLFLFFSGLR